MVADSAHSNIESELRKAPTLFIPLDVIRCIGAARPKLPFTIKWVDHTFFKDFSGIVDKNYPDIKPANSKVVDIRGLKYEPRGKIFFKTDLADDWANLRPRTRANPRADGTLTTLYQRKLPITASKFKNLQEIKEVMIPNEFWSFYDNLPHL